MVACENIRFSSLFADRDVSRRATSATLRQKFHTDWFYVISMEFLSLSRRRSSSRNVLIGDERGERMFSQAIGMAFLRLFSLSSTPTLSA